jgi:uncharacterized integral membrane protein
MLVLLVAVISGIAIAYFGMQNINPVTIRLNELVWNDVPLYLVIVGSLLAGLFMAGILYFAKSIPQSLLHLKSHTLQCPKDKRVLNRMGAFARMP